MNHLHIDIETYAEADLTKTGVYKYAADKTFEILLFAYSLNYQPVQIIDLTQGEKIPANIIRLLTDENTVKHAYNAQFERICLTHHLQQLNLLNSTYLPPEQWKCTMVWAASTSLPLSLQNVGTILGVEKQKLETGKTLIRKFTKPYLGKRYQPTEHLEEWAEFKKYCIRDVETEIEIEEKLAPYPMPETEWEYYWDDQHINDTGIHIDANFVENALKIDETHRTILTKEATTITRLANPNSPIALKQWLNQHGCPIQTLTKQEVADTIKQTKNPQVRRVLEIRQELAKTSTRKYQAMLNTILDGRGHGFLQFNGAGRTGRFAGRLVQVQNLPRNYLPDLDTARNIVADGNHELLNLLYPSVPDTLSQLTRTAFTPKQEHLFTVADYSAIEARVLAWLANETTTLNAFKNGQDLYCATASAMFGVPVEKHGANSELRQKGKIAVLACGYGGSVGALKAMGALNMGLKETELQPIVTAWRKANPNTVKLWQKIDELTKNAIKHHQTGNWHGLIQVKANHETLAIRLPSGRHLYYRQPQITTGKYGQQAITYRGSNNGKTWTTIETYGAKIIENITQATARDLLTHAIHTILPKHQIVMHIHDEIVCETPTKNAQNTLNNIVKTMCTPPTWATGLPLSADGYICSYYQKD